MKAIKRALLGAAKALGVMAGVRASAWRNDRLLILCYHGVSRFDEHEWNPSYYIDPFRFDQRLRTLEKGRYAVLPLGEAVERLSARDLPPRSVSITFDDGLYDFYRQAFPMLQRYGFPATVYLTTYHTEKNLPVFRPACSYMLWKQRGRVVSAATLPLGLRDLNLRTAASRQALVEALTRHAEERALSADGKHALLRDLARAIDLDFDDLCARRVLHLMTPDEVGELSRGGVDIQLHTHRHRSPVDEGLYRPEIADNRQRIECFTGKTPTHFCYPSGATDPRFLPWLEQEGVITATTCEPGLATATTNPLLLPRLVDDCHHAPIEYDGWLSGLAEWLPRRRLAAHH